MPETTEKENDIVSQSDIDQLLAQAEETASDVPDDQQVPEAVENGDEDNTLEDDAPVDDAESTEEVDDLFDEETDEEQSDSEEIPDRVILEEVSDEHDEKPRKGKITWAPQKQFWIAISIVCTFGVTINGVLWPQNQKSVEFAKPAVLWFPVGKPSDVSTESHFLATPSSISMKGFIIPAPLDRKDITYVAADISIELTTDKALTLVKDHAPFYRNIIYDVIGDALKAVDKSKISEISLKISILKALNSAVPERSVKDVIVDTFVMF